MRCVAHLQTSFSLRLQQNGRPFDVIANLAWEEQTYDLDSTNTLFWETFVDGTLEAQGQVDLRDSRALPSTVAAGTAVVDNSGTHKVQVKITLDAETNENERDYQSFAAGASFVPLIIVILFAATTKMVRCNMCTFFCSTARPDSLPHRRLPDLISSL